MKKNLTSFGGISFSERVQQNQQRLRFDKKVKFSPKKIEQEKPEVKVASNVLSRIFSLTKQSPNDCSDGIFLPSSFLNLLDAHTRMKLNKLTLLVNVSKVHFKSAWDQATDNDLQKQMK